MLKFGTLGFCAPEDTYTISALRQLFHMLKHAKTIKNVSWKVPTNATNFTNHIGQIWHKCITLNSKIHRNKARAWDVALSDSTSKKCSNSAFPTSKHQKTSDLEVSDDLENLSVPTLWRISKFEEVLVLIFCITKGNLCQSQICVPNFNCSKF